MNSYRLRIGTFVDHGNGIIESFVNEAVDVSVDDVDEIIALIDSLDPRPRGLLANRENSYSFQFSALQKIATVDVIKYVAEVNYGERPMQRVGNALWPKFMSVAFFGDRQHAWDWLLKKFDNLPGQ